jgi:hypothetical protein
MDASWQMYRDYDNHAAFSLRAAGYETSTTTDYESAHPYALYFRLPVEVR